MSRHADNYEKLPAHGDGQSMFARRLQYRSVWGPLPVPVVPPTPFVKIDAEPPAGKSPYTGTCRICGAALTRRAGKGRGPTLCPGDGPCRQEAQRRWQNESNKKRRSK